MVWTSDSVGLPLQDLGQPVPPQLTASKAAGPGTVPPADYSRETPPRGWLDGFAAVGRTVGARRPSEATPSIHPPFRVHPPAGPSATLPMRCQGRTRAGCKGSYRAANSDDVHLDSAHGVSLQDPPTDFLSRTSGQPVPARHIGQPPLVLTSTGWPACKAARWPRPRLPPDTSPPGALGCANR